MAPNEYRNIRLNVFTAKVASILQPGGSKCTCSVAVTLCISGVGTVKRLIGGGGHLGGGPLGWCEQARA